jgi:hypothetical protein
VTVRRTRAPLCWARCSGRARSRAARPDRGASETRASRRRERLARRTRVRPRGSAGTAARSATHASPRRGTGPVSGPRRGARAWPPPAPRSSPSPQRRRTVRATRRGQESTRRETRTHCPDRPSPCRPSTGRRRSCHAAAPSAPAGVTMPPVRLRRCHVMSRRARWAVHVVSWKSARSSAPSGFGCLTGA